MNIKTKPVLLIFVLNY